MINRRQFIKLSGAAGAGLFLSTKFGFVRPASAQEGPLPGGTLDPTSIDKYVTPLVKPPALVPTGQDRDPNIDYYELTVRQFQQPILPSNFPATTVWSYVKALQPRTFNYPAFTIEATVNRPVRIKWINGLVDDNGNYLPHLLPVDPTLHWANPPGPRDRHGTADDIPYTGPVPIVVHLHGGHTPEESDGYTEAWYLPNANNIPETYFRTGTWYDTFQNIYEEKYGQAWEAGAATFHYPNDQAAATLWFHDHALGITRLNVYAGPSGFYLLRGGEYDLPEGVLPGPAPGRGINPFGTFYEIPIAIQDRSFNQDGSLFYPDSREFFDGYAGPYIPNTPVPPVWNPEFFGNTMVVNGRTWPFLEVEPRRYRFRLLNGCNSRFLVLKMVTDPLAERPASPVLPFWQIGSDLSFLSAPVELPELLMGPAERADVIVDFTEFPAGTEIYMINEGPDAPFGGFPVADEELADPGTTGQVMKFVVVRRRGTDRSVPPAELTLPAPPLPGSVDNTRAVGLHELIYVAEDIPFEAMLGTPSEPKDWENQLIENPELGATEEWAIHNLTEDAHPIHVHLVHFEVVGRGPDGNQPPEPGERGRKDTVIAYPEEVTRIKANFDLPGRYVWHCHILEHEDNEMMLPFHVGPIEGTPEAAGVDEIAPTGDEAPAEPTPEEPAPPPDEQPTPEPPAEAPSE